MCAAKWRAAAGMGCGVVYSFGGVVVTAIAYGLTDWRHFQLACAALMILYVPYWW